MQKIEQFDYSSLSYDDMLAMAQEELVLPIGFMKALLAKSPLRRETGLESRANTDFGDRSLQRTMAKKASIKS